MFRGANKVTLDAKGRMAMPARYRDTLVERSEGRLVATVDRADRCLLIYPLPDWEEIERKLMRLPTLNPQARRLQRLMVGHATDLELDSHGRVLVPPKLRDYAGLWHTRPALAALMTVCLLSLGGLPPTAGFIGKWYIFSAAVSAGSRSAAK